MRLLCVTIYEVILATFVLRLFVAVHSVAVMLTDWKSFVLFHIIYLDVKGDKSGDI